jgi:hypothetical protein
VAHRTAPPVRDYRRRTAPRDGEGFRLDPQTILLAEDTAGGGHRWSIVGDEPWQRVYVRLPADAVVPFTPDAGSP